MRSNLTYANVVATLALLVAVGTGSAWAAKSYVTNANLRTNSISGTKLKHGTVRTSKLARNSVTAPKIKIGSIPGNRLKDGSVKLVKLAPDARGALTGPTGPVGPTGPQGPAGTPVAEGLVPLAVFSADNLGVLTSSSFRLPVTGVAVAYLGPGEYGITLNGLAVPQDTHRICTHNGGGPRTVTTIFQSGIRVSAYEVVTGAKSNASFDCAIYAR